MSLDLHLRGHGNIHQGCRFGLESSSRQTLVENSPFYLDLEAEGTICGFDSFRRCFWGTKKCMQPSSARLHSTQPKGTKLGTQSGMESDSLKGGWFVTTAKNVQNHQCYEKGGTSKHSKHSSLGKPKAIFITGTQLNTNWSNDLMVFLNTFSCHVCEDADPSFSINPQEIHRIPTFSKSSYHYWFYSTATSIFANSPKKLSSNPPRQNPSVASWQSYVDCWHPPVLLDQHEVPQIPRLQVQNPTLLTTWTMVVILVGEWWDRYFMAYEIIPKYNWAVHLILYIKQATGGPLNTAQ